MGGDDDSALLVLSRDLGNDIPHKSLGLWVDTSGWLIEEDEWRIAEHGHGYRKLSFVPSRELIGFYIDVITKVHVIDLLLNDPFSQLLFDSFE